MHQTLILQGIFADQERRQFFADKSGSRGVHEAAKLREPDQAVVSFDFYQAYAGSQRLFEQWRRDRNVL
ncbi:MAG TPA: hypothetical protein VK604_01505, partial [Bryobacteraceae bacterium]|nr:hypothetical protein [Bryobacteraceae bacterium]